ncbi:hypothetical protein [Chamaesiphon sp. VAR_48_metabat_403]|nr:hypothetical protein [Chamaesiphon sp. VAR_48_metabat_403]
MSTPNLPDVVDLGRDLYYGIGGMMPAIESNLKIAIGVDKNAVLTQ